MVNNALSIVCFLPYSCKKTFINQWRALQHLHFRDSFSAERPKRRRGRICQCRGYPRWNNCNARHGLWFSARCKTDIRHLAYNCANIRSMSFLPIGQFCRYFFRFFARLLSSKQKLQDNSFREMFFSFSVSLILSLSFSLGT